MPRFNSQVRILIHSYRYRLADPDGISAKAVVDGLVRNGILADDTAEQVQEVSFRQNKIRKPEKEKTEIIIKEV